MRGDVEKMVPADEDGTSVAFPFSFQFLYWEEIGVIDEELVRNLLICSAVVLVVIGVLLPRPRIAVWVVLCILTTLVDLVGLLHWWGVTISGISTIYILISVGLAVDYSAHIAHSFAMSTGTPEERAVKALERIGPSVFNAIMSTFLAVVVLSTSQSYIFRVFFKTLFLVVVVGGLHGLWLLPVLLSLFGGSRAEEQAQQAHSSKASADTANKQHELELN